MSVIMSTDHSDAGQVEHSAPSKVRDHDEEYSVAAGVGHVAQDMQRVRGDASWNHVAGSWPSFY